MEVHLILRFTMDTRGYRGYGLKHVHDLTFKRDFRVDPFQL
jgi:hypothetical protein